MSVLYSANAGFGQTLSRSVRERSIAAWLYLRYRHTDDKLRSKPGLSNQLRQLGETLLQEVRDDPGDAFIRALRSQVIDLIDSLDETQANTGER